LGGADRERPPVVVRLAALHIAETGQTVLIILERHAISQFFPGEGSIGLHGARDSMKAILLNRN
jgi:hypothetical protein